MRKMARWPWALPWALFRWVAVSQPAPTTPVFSVRLVDLRVYPVLASHVMKVVEARGIEPRSRACKAHSVPRSAPWQRAVSSLALLALLLTGCATGAVAPRVDTISFDRAQFAFMLAEVGVLIQLKCRDPKADKVECARLSEQYQAVRKQVMTPPAPSVAPAGGGLDMEQLMKLLGVLIGAAT